jgi:hypothetical protein
MLLPWALLLLAADVLAVKHHDFKTCSQSGFCRRGRALASRAKEASSTWKSPYSIDAQSIAISADKSSFTATVNSSIYPNIMFKLDVRAHDDGVFRVRMNEVDGLRKRYDEAAKWALVEEPKLSKKIAWTQTKKEIKAVNGKVELKVTYSPLRIILLRDGKEEVVLNGRGLLHMEHFRLKDEPATPVDAPPAQDEQIVMDAPSEPQPPSPKLSAWFEGEEEDGWWDEQFNSWTDSKPKGKRASLKHRSCSNVSKDLNLFLLTLLSPTMVIFMVFLNTPLEWISPKPLARMPNILTRIVSGTSMSSSMKRIPPWHCTERFLSSTHTPSILLSVSLVQ